MFIYILRNRAHSFVAENLALWPIIGPTNEASISLLLGRKQRWAVDSFTCVNWMMKLVVCEISSPHGYSKVRNTSLSFLWPRTGPHILYVLGSSISTKEHATIYLGGTVPLDSFRLFSWSGVNLNDINDPSTEKMTAASLKTAVMHFNSQPRSQAENRGKEVPHFRILLSSLDRIEFSVVKLRLLIAR